MYSAQFEQKIRLSSDKYKSNELLQCSQKTSLLI